MRWEQVQPMRQHSGVQDAFGTYYLSIITTSWTLK